MSSEANKLEKNDKTVDKVSSPKAMPKDSAVTDTAEEWQLLVESCADGLKMAIATVSVLDTDSCSVY